MLKPLAEYLGDGVALLFLSIYSGSLTSNSEWARFHAFCNRGRCWT